MTRVTSSRFRKAFRTLADIVRLIGCLFINFDVCLFSFDDGDFDDVEDEEPLDDLENVEDVRTNLLFLN